MSTESLAKEYSRQKEFRGWDRLIDYSIEKGSIPAQARVLDLGCGAGGCANVWAARGFPVMAVDRDQNLLDLAKTFAHPLVHLSDQNLEDLQLQSEFYDVIWCSFVIAYFSEKVDVLKKWKEVLKPGGIIILYEVNGLWSVHEPNPYRHEFEKLEGKMHLSGYDMKAGGNLAHILTTAGFEVVDKSEWTDQELAFDGPANEKVTQAWMDRFDRPAVRDLLLEKLENFQKAREGFMQCLRSPDHRVTAKPCMVIARKPAPPKSQL